MTETLTIGPVHTLTEDRTYALPPKTVIISSDGAGQLEISVNGTDWEEIDLPAVIGSIFIRSVDSDSSVVLKSTSGGESVEEEDMSIESVSISLTQNEFNNLDTVPKELVPADPANVLVPARLMLQFICTPGGFAGGSNLAVRYTGIATILTQNIAVNTQVQTGIVTGSTQSTGALLDNSTLLNKALNLVGTLQTDGTVTSVVATLWFYRFPGI